MNVNKNSEFYLHSGIKLLRIDQGIHQGKMKKLRGFSISFSISIANFEAFL